jgi:hypothetical protein
LAFAGRAFAFHQHAFKPDANGDTYAKNKNETQQSEHDRLSGRGQRQDAVGNGMMVKYIGPAGLAKEC